MMGYNWSDLPEDIVELILKKIDTPADFLNFAAVCKCWYSLSVQNYDKLPESLPICNFFPKASPLPMLLIPFGNNQERKPFLYSITDKRIYNCFSESVFHNKWIPGSARGWLVTVDKKDKSINLLNPLTTQQIALPGLCYFDKPFSQTLHHEAEDCWYVVKATILFYASGKPENSVIVAIVSSQRRICFCRVGDKNWTTLDRSPTGICDVVNFKGKLWAVDQGGNLFAIEIGRSHMKLIMIVGQLLPMGPGERYLVESRGRILMLHRCTVEDNRTGEFRVFRLVKSASKYKARYWLEDESRQKIKGVQSEWVEVESIGNQMIFVGLNHSLALDSRAYPGCRGNCVYFADHFFDRDMPWFFHWWGLIISHDVGVYHLKNKRVTSLKGVGKKSTYHALWLSPNGW